MALKVPSPEDATKRAAYIADLRTFADFLDRNSWAPLPHYPQVQVDLEAPDVWDGGLAGLARLRQIAANFGEKPDEHTDDRTSVMHRFGVIEYKVITWHRSGRPVEGGEREAELKRLRARVAELEATTDPDATGLAYSRTDSEADDPTPVSPARVPLHTGSVVDGGELITDKAAQ